MGYELTKKKRIVSATADDISGTGDTLVYATPVPVKLLRWGLIVGTALDTTTDLVLGLNVQGANATDVPVQTATVTGTHANGVVIDFDVNVDVAQSGGEDTLTGGTTPQTSLIDVPPTGYILVPAGSTIEIEITTAGTSGTAYGWIEFIEQDLVPAQTTDTAFYLGYSNAYTPVNV